MIHGINKLQNLKNKEFFPPHGIDDPDILSQKNMMTKHEWENYPIRDYSYKYNSWGFRDDDFEQHLEKPVIIVLGDSFTVNIGGPREHSWSYQLGHCSKIPVLNFAVDGIGNDGIKIIHDQVIQLFDVKHVFVVYSFFHRRVIGGELVQHVDSSHEEDIENFEGIFLSNSIYSFLPQWCWHNQEKRYIAKNYPNSIKEIWFGLHKNPLPNKNRDNFHMSYSANALYKNYFEKFL